MTDEGEETAVSPGDRRQYGRVVVAVLAAATLVLAAAALPAVVGSGAAPALSLVPLEQANAGGDAADAAADAASGRDAAGAAGAAGAADATGATGGATNLSGSELGALSSAESTRIGGQTAPGSGDNPLRNQSTEIHFVVESEQPSYWRTGAYGEYTGQGFERVDDTQSFDGRVDPGPLRGERVAYEVRLRQSATALPTVWRPARVDTPEGTRLAAGTSLSVTDGVPAGTTYRGVSYAPAREPVVLRTAGRNYPAAVREQYLGLPDDPDTERVARFTDNLTSDANTPYTTAVRIEEWLETNKEYSLSATHDPADGTVASQFVFEMSTGYCEYFAATMTAMLRTQDIPARYVVGYSTGQQTAPGEYTVRAMNAHAWVEVYFPDVGWVRFDPTPGSSRLTTERRAFADGTDQSTAAYNPDESGSPGESFTPAQTPTGGDQTVDGATAEADGQRANATGQTADGTGVTSGTATNESGTVIGGERTATGEDSESGTTDSGRETGSPPTGEDTTTTVTERVTGTPAGDVTATGDRTNTSGTTTGGEGTTSGGTTTTDDQTTEDETTTDDQTTEDETTTDDQTTEDETTTDDQTDDTRENNETTGADPSGETTTRPPIRAELNRTAVPGATVAVTITRDGEPVVARVSFNGAPTGVTNASGVVVGEVPYARELNVTVTPRTRGALASGGTTAVATSAAAPAGNVTTVATSDATAITPTTNPATTENDTGSNSTTYTLDTRASVSVVGSVRSGREVTVVATVSDVPVRGGAVLLGGSRVARTDRLGRATVRLPTEPGTYTLGVQRGPVAGNRSVTIHRLNLTSEVEWPIAVPFAPVTVTTTLDGDTVDGATVRRGGAVVGETGPSGRVTATLPARDRSTFVARAGGQRATTAVTGVLRTTAVLVIGVTTLVGVVAVAARRVGVGPTAVARRLRRASAAAAQAVLAGVLWVADAADRAGAALVRLVADLVTRRLALTQLPARLAHLSAAAAAVLAAGVLAAFGRIRGPLGRRGETPTGTAGGDDDGQTLSAQRVIRKAWRQFVTGLSVRRVRTKTPGELARWALERDGLPAAPVRRLRDGYRAVEYGAADPTAYVDRVRTALAGVRGDAADDSGDDERTDTQDRTDMQDGRPGDGTGHGNRSGSGDGTKSEDGSEMGGRS